MSSNRQHFDSPTNPSNFTITTTTRRRQNDLLPTKTSWLQPPYQQNTIATTHTTPANKRGHCSRPPLQPIMHPMQFSTKPAPQHCLKSPRRLKFCPITTHPSLLCNMQQQRCNNQISVAFDWRTGLDVAGWQQLNPMKLGLTLH